MEFLRVYARFWMTVHRESVPVNSLREFVEFVKARPGKLVYFTPGNGALHHFAMESLKIEAGVPGVELVSWFGIVAPAGTPRPIIVRLKAEFNRALQKPEVRERFAQQGLEVGGGSPEEMAARIRRDDDRYVKIVKATGLKSD